MAQPKTVEMRARKTFENREHEGHIVAATSFFTTEERAGELERRNLATRVAGVPGRVGGAAAADARPSPASPTGAAHGAPLSGAALRQAAPASQPSAGPEPERKPAATKDRRRK